MRKLVSILPRLRRAIPAPLLLPRLLAHPGVAGLKPCSADVMYAQRHQPRVYLLPRRLHWSVAVEDDTAACYNATDADATQLALRFQHRGGS